MNRFILAVYLKFKSFRFKRINNECCLKAVEDIRAKLDKHYCDSMRNLRIQHEEDLQQTARRLKAEHQKEKQEMYAEFEFKISELRKIIDEKNEIIKDSEKAYTTITEMLPKMKALADYNKMLVEQETIKQIEKQRKYNMFQDECDVLNRILEKRTGRLTKFWR